MEPFAAVAIDPDQVGMADGLRAAAAEKYPNQFQDARRAARRHRLLGIQRTGGHVERCAR